MQGCRQAGGKARIMHLPVGDDDRPGNPGTGLGGHRLGQGGQSQRSCILVTIGKTNDAQFSIVQRGHRAGQLRQCGLGL